ncbi:uncharacterized protein LOC101852930 [Aplysia californica]|uniref:Uncharacterized protein LOC101852930 n=1 Tax=Aplysia californica TaxID=6500 RepID=A0ABM0JRD0_APLCA|nr:uncharacterized protein LOC101852930 [Aplysia californica]
MTVDHSSLSKKKTCQKCALQGVHSPLHLFQLNDEEALWMCKNVDCTFMPSSNWESLVVKRSISEIPTPSSRRKFSSLSSRSSASSVNSVCSAPVLQVKSDLAFQSRSSTPALKHYRQGDRPGTSALSIAATGSSVSVSSVRKSIDSPVPAASEAVSEVKEHKSIIPVAPFLCGHAHIFSSFETKRIEDRRQGRVQQSFLPRSSSRSGVGKQLLPVRSRERGDPVSSSQSSRPAKRRGSSLDSDSQSSSSGSSYSRPSSPSGSCEVVRGKKVRKIVVTPDTLNKIVSGELKVQIAKAPGAKSSSVVLNPVGGKKQSSRLTPSGDIRVSSQGPTSQGDRLEEQARGGVAAPATTNGGFDFEVTPVGTLDALLKSQSAQQSLSSLQLPSVGAVQDPSQLKAHIEAINSHIQAINAALANSSSPLLIRPAEISRPVTSAGTKNKTSDPVSSDNFEQGTVQGEAFAESDCVDSDFNLQDLFGPSEGEGHADCVSTSMIHSDFVNFDGKEFLDM